MLRILGRSSSINVRKVLWTCGELGLAYEQEAWGTGFRSTDTAEFRAMNPNALVPVIDDAGFVLWESNTICRYLAAREKRADLLPAAPAERARVEQWMDWGMGELNNAWRYAFLGLVRKSPSHADPKAIEASAASWNRHMAMLDAQLARTGAYAAGDAFTLADVVLGLATHRWKFTPIQHAALPAVEAYHRLLCTRPAFAPYSRPDEP